MAVVTDPALLAQLNGTDTTAAPPASAPATIPQDATPVTDPSVLAQLNGTPQETVPAPTPTPAAAPAGEDRSMYQRMIDAYKGSSVEGVPGVIGRNALDLLGNDPQKVAEAQRQIREEYEAKAASDPWWKPDGNIAGNILERGVPTLIGHIFGNPENLIGGGGEGLGAKVLRQGALSGGLDVGTQLADLGQDVQDKFSVARAAGAAATGGALAGLHELGVEGYKKFFGNDAPVVDAPAHAQGGKDVLPDGTVGVAGAHLSPEEFRQSIVDKMQERNSDGSFKNSADDIRKYVSEQGADPDQFKGLDAGIAARDAGKPYGVASPGTKGVTPHDAVTPVTPEAAPVKSALDVHDDNIAAAQATHEDNVAAYDEAYRAGKDLKPGSPEYKEWIEQTKPLAEAADQSHKDLLAAADAHDTASSAQADRQGAFDKSLQPTPSEQLAAGDAARNAAALEGNGKVTGENGEAPPEGKAEPEAPAKPIQTLVGRREAIVAATKRLNADSGPGKTAFVQPFPENEPDYYRFQHTTLDGKKVGGYYTYNPETKVVENLSIGPKDGANKFGPTVMRGILSDVRDQHPDLRGIEGYRIGGSNSVDPKFIKQGLDNGTGTDLVPSRSGDTGKPPVADTPVASADAPGEKAPSEVPKETTPEGPPSVEDRLTKQLKAAAKAREEQTKSYSEEKKDRYKESRKAADVTDGEAGFHSELAALKGEYKKVDFANEHDFTQEDIDGLFDKIKNHPDVKGFASIRARYGLAKILDGKIPQPSELVELKKVFSPDFIKTVMKSREDMANFSGRKPSQGELFSGNEVTSAGPIKTLLPEGKEVDPDKFVRVKGQGDLFETPEPGKGFTGQKEMFSGNDTLSKGPQRSLLPEEKPVDPDKFTVPKGQMDLFLKNDKDPIRGPTQSPGKSGILSQANAAMRGMMASMDMSGLFNQGGVMAGRGSLWKAIPTMVKSFGDEAFYDSAMHNIMVDPLFKKSQDAGLFFAREDAPMSKHEENFMAHLGKVPVYGPLYKAGERAYTGLLNKVRFDSYKNIVSSYEKAGVQLTDEDHAALSSFINNATGRGTFGGKSAQNGPFLSALLFAPRYLKSRIDLLNPVYYAKLHSQSPLAAQYAAGTMARYAAGVVTILGLAKAAGADVETDPRSTNFAKIVIPSTNTHISPLGAFQPIIRLAAQVVNNHEKLKDGTIRDLSDGKYGKDTALTKVLNFGRTKLSPLPGLVADKLAGTDLVGNPFTWTSAIGSRLVPMWMQDAYDGYSTSGAKGAAIAAPLSFLGVPTSTYDPNAKRAKRAKTTESASTTTPASTLVTDPAILAQLNAK